MGSRGLSFVNHKSELIKKYDETIKEYNLLNESDMPLIQEYVSGQGAGTEMLYWKGELKIKFSHMRIREFPVNGGPSTARISIKDKKMEHYAKLLLDELGWHGVSMVEFKYDLETQTPYLMEINPRFWGSLNQAYIPVLIFPTCFIFYPQGRKFLPKYLMKQELKPDGWPAMFYLFCTIL